MSEPLVLTVYTMISTTATGNRKVETKLKAIV